MSAAATFQLNDLLTGDVLSRFKSVLAPQATVVVTCQATDRLPTTVLAAALAATTASPGYLRFDGLSILAQLAISVVDSERRLAVAGTTRIPSPVGDRPFQVTINPDGHLTMVLQKGIGQHSHLSDTLSHEWVRGLDIPAASIDLSQVDHLNSLLVAWMLQVNQGVGNGRCRLINVGRQAVAQLNQLRLNHLLNIV